ncbi:hypothetical protein [Halalkalicoccus tibetensis]|uniref:Small CPxCG-related zinc finger protein n=1 Tax=Halalkalicoccus tibetensis TaxID=175632 RepID=A0ABD5VAV7_9EURY
MSEWTCPVCRGGFPGDAMLEGIACPWCEHMLEDAAQFQSELIERNILSDADDADR